MPYVNPKTVMSPKNVVRKVHVIHNTGPGGWSVALIDWEGEEAVAIRWNGERGNGIGNPQSHGRPTWFVVPKELAHAVKDCAENLSHSSETGLLAGYKAMAEDREREREALEWSEALIGDASGQER
jgi:hypothetical protein